MDQETLARIKDGLAHSQHPQLREVSVALTQGGVVLTGTVRTYYMKQMAQELARSVNGSEQIVNKIDVTE
mgnify:CR=1 FL=1